jgi:hypothetical protein
MDEAELQDWISRNTDASGVLAFGVYAPGKKSFIQPCTSSLSAPGLENAWRCVAETIPVLQLNRFPTARFRFVYGEAVVHCERGRDGTCLGIFAQRNEGTCPPAEIERLLTEFHALT